MSTPTPWTAADTASQHRLAIYEVNPFLTGDHDAPYATDPSWPFVAVKAACSCGRDMSIRMDAKTIVDAAEGATLTWEVALAAQTEAMQTAVIRAAEGHGVHVAQEHAARRPSIGAALQARVQQLQDTQDPDRGRWAIEVLDLASALETLLDVAQKVAPDGREDPTELEEAIHLCVGRLDSARGAHREDPTGDTVTDALNDVIVQLGGLA